MSCIILKSPLGERRIPENVSYQLLKGEKIIGVDWACDGSDQTSVDAELAKSGLKLGDAIAWVTKKFGIQQCSACAARQQILNHARELGFAETLKQIKETMR